MSAVEFNDEDLEGLEEDLYATPAEDAQNLTQLPYHFERCTSPKKQCSLIHEELLANSTSLLDAKADPSAVKPVADLVVECIFSARHWKKSGQRDLEFAIRSLASSQSFAKQFVKLYLKFAPTRSVEEEISTLIRWGCQLFLGAQGFEKEAKVRDAMAKVQCQLLSSLTFSCKRFPSVKKQFKELFSEFPVVKESFFDAISSSSENYLTAIHILLSPSGQNDEKFTATHRHQFIDWYREIVLNTRDAPSCHVNFAFSPLVSTLSHTELKEAILPIFERQLKRGASHAMILWNSMLTELKLDLGAYVDTFSKPILAELTNKDADRRNIANSIVSKMAPKISDGSVLPKFVKAFTDTLAKSRATPQVKTSIVQALSDLIHAKSAGSTVFNTFAATVIRTLTTQLSKEVSSDVKTMLIEVLGAWCATQEEIPENGATALLGLIRGELKKNTKFIPVALKTTIKLIKNHGQESKFCSKLCEGKVEVALTGYIDQAKRSPKDRGQGLLALALLFQTTARQVTRECSPEAKKYETMLSELLQDVDSFVNSRVHVDKAPEADGLAHVGFLEVILTPDYWHIITKDPSSFSSFGESIIALCTHSNYVVKRAALTLIDQVIKHEPNLTSLLLPAFHEFLIKPPPLTARPPAELHAHALLKIFGAVLPSPQDIPRIAFLALHPLMGNARVWKKLTSRWSLEADEKLDLNRAFETNVDIILALLHESTSLFGPQKLMNQARAAISLVCLVTKRLPLLVADKILADVAEVLSPPELVQISPKEAAIYHTPEGEVCDYVEGSVYVPKVAKRNLTEEEEWELKLKEELAAENNEIDEKTKAILDEESEIRARVKTIAQKIESGLDLLSLLAQECPSLTHDWLLPLVLPKLYPLLAHPVTLGPAKECHIAMTQCLDAHLQFPEAVARSIQAIFEKGSDKVFAQYSSCDAEAGRAGFAARLLHQAVGLEEDDFQRRLSSPTFIFCLPLIRAIVLSPRKLDQPGLDDALVALCAHCAADINMSTTSTSSCRFPMESMVSLLLYTLAEFPTYRDMCQDAMEDFARALNKSEVSLLIGDKGILSPHPRVQVTSLNSIEKVASAWDNPEFMLNLWVSCHCQEEKVADTAEALWKRTESKVAPDFCEPLLAFLKHNEATIRFASSEAIGGALILYPGKVDETVDELIALFKDSNDYLDSKNDGLRSQAVMVHRWPTRVAVGMALAASNESFNNATLLERLFEFILNYGLADLNDQVWNQMLTTSLRLISDYGGEHIGLLVDMFEKYLTMSHADADVGDRISEGAVVLLGNVAQHMDEKDPRIEQLVDTLVQTLNTPSYAVQTAVSKCLAPLMPCVRESAGRLIGTAVKQLSDGKTYGERKGAAFGLAGMCLGLKLTSLKRFNVLDSLDTFIHARDANIRQGALFAYERLFAELGNTFEPYVRNILPSLLGCFGDKDGGVKQAAADASQEIMRHLTGYGVEMVLPLVLEALDERSWRTKLESIGMLGAMAYCAPRQLSTALPMIVPRLMEVMADPNGKVQAASVKALGQIASVVRNPEVRALSPVLLEALSNPDKTAEALDKILSTKFVHSVDPPSLALIVPILRKGLKSRNTKIKKMAAQVVGSICALTSDVQDVIPYASTLWTYLKQILLDPIPEVRFVAAKALGTLYLGIGGARFGDVLEWLMDMLRGETNSVQRSGAAMGISQMLFVQGPAVTTEKLPELFAELKNDDPLVREGFMEVFVFLPEMFGPSFQDFTGVAFPEILTGLSDQNAGVREMSLRAGMSLVMKYGRSKTMLMLPALQEGLQSSDWRIRLASVQLIGCLLLKLAGAKGQFLVRTEVDDSKETASIATQEQEMLIEDVLGTETRDQVLGSVYLLRSDPMEKVSAMAWRVWKSVVQNTPRMLTTILPTMMDRILSNLTSELEEERIAAGNGLADLVSKMGDDVLQFIVPILQDKLLDPNPLVRHGVCLGLRETIGSAHKSLIGSYLPDLVPCVRDALCDNEDEVRIAAGLAFRQLYNNIGRKALDEIVPSMLKQLEQHSDNMGLADLVVGGIYQVVDHAGRNALQMLLPTLLKSPLTQCHARALGQLAESFKPCISKWVGQCANAYIDSLASDEKIEDEKSRARIEESAELLFTNGIGSDSVFTLLDTLLECIEHDDRVPYKASATFLVKLFLDSNNEPFRTSQKRLLRSLLKLFVHEDEELQQAGLKALTSMVKVADEEEMNERLEYLRLVFQSIFDITRDNGWEAVPGFCLKKGLAPLIKLLQYGLLHGEPSVRTISANGFGDLVRNTTVKALKPFVIKMTGPLIRIVGDRFPSSVKSAILNTLGLLISKSGAAIKPFFPQLQTCFSKALHDNDREVRQRASSALSSLLGYVRRIDPAINDLANNIQEPSSKASRISILRTLATTLLNPAAGSKIGQEALERTSHILAGLLNNDDDNIRRWAGRSLGSVAFYMEEGDQASTIDAFILHRSGDWKSLEAQLLAVSTLLSSASDDVKSSAAVDLSGITTFVAEMTTTENVMVREQSAKTCAVVLVEIQRRGEDIDLANTLLDAVSLLINDPLDQVRPLACAAIRDFAEVAPEHTATRAADLVPRLMKKANDNVGPTRRGVHSALYFVLGYHISQEEGECRARAFPSDVVNFCQKSISKMTPKSKKESKEGKGV